LLAHLFWRGLSNRDYWSRIPERFGWAPVLDRPSIWVHAVSVGEVQAAASLVRALLEQYPHIPLVFTTMTPTGSERVRDLFGERVVHCYAPFDLSLPVRCFFRRVQPLLAIILETELWPNLYHYCGKRNVPLVLASARVSTRSVRRYRWLLSLFRETLSHGIVIGAQSEADAERFLSLRASPERTDVTGNIKFDFELPSQVAERGQMLREEHAPGRPVWVAASTHQNEEEQVLDAHRHVRERFPDALLILVPRHPERFAGIAALVEDEGFSVTSRSSGASCSADTEVFLGDSMGELTTFYAASDVAFVGGSLVRVGGHNLLEPAALGIPSVTGPYNFNAEEIAELLQENGASHVVDNAPALGDEICRLLADPELRATQGEMAKSLLEKNRGTLGRLMKLIEPLLPRRRGMFRRRAPPPA